MKRPLAMFAVLVSISSIGAGLTGCGQKGPLYLPDQQANQDECPTQRCTQPKKAVPAPDSE